MHFIFTNIKQNYRINQIINTSERLLRLVVIRTDNAIKNHWHSSVKKKLESYRASGLLAQFQGMPKVRNPNLMSLRLELRSRDNTDQEDMVEAEGISECSEGSDADTFSHFDTHMTNVTANAKEIFQTSENVGQKKVYNLVFHL